MCQENDSLHNEIASDHSPESGNSRANRIDMSQAEEFTGIRHQQVSKWQKQLGIKDKYRNALPPQ
jgi:hypothetical protein